MLALALALGALQVAPPTGVNGDVIGTAEEFKVEGPARVCFVQGGVDIAKGEVSYLSYMGIHWAAVRIVGQHGDYKVSEGDIWNQPRHGRKPVPNAGKLNVARFGSGSTLRYGVYGRPEYSRDTDRLLIWVDGLKGGASDLAILRRIIPAVEDKSSCKRRFNYGWFFEDEVEKK